MLKITREFVTDTLSPDNKAVVHCESGDTVWFETRNCYDDRLAADGSVFEEENALENPATGPLFVCGAQKGDILKVEILEIKLKGKAYMRQSIVGGAFFERVSERVVREFDVSGETVQFNDKLAFPIKTMIGVIGTAPKNEAIPTITPGDHGGNMDCTRIIKGSTIYLPVNVEGALLSMGDLHALMGDGEVMICGMEAAGDVTVKVTVVKGRKLPTPCLITAEGEKFVTIQSEEDLMAASKKSCNKMLDFLIENTDLDEYDGGKLLSLKGDLIINQIVNPLKTVRMELDKSILNAYEINLA
ncbi:MAG: acetamidase [Clostridia bacterium]|nr:acetamidase [Clostridia bacterium]